MKNIINELKQVFEFEREINETNIALDEIQQALVIKDISILNILDTYKKEYNIKFNNVDFNCNLFNLFEKYNNINFDGFMEFVDCYFNNEISGDVIELAIDNANDSVIVCNYSIKFNKCFFKNNIELSNFNFLKSIEFKGTEFGDENYKINANFTNINFNNSIKFEEVNFYCNTKFDLCNFGSETMQTYIDFKIFYVYGNLEFSGGNFYSDLNFLQSIFGKENSQNEVKFEAVTFYNNINFSNNEFYSNFEISSCKFKSNKEKTNDCIFNSKNNFYNKFYIAYNTFEIPLNFIGIKFINNKDEIVFEELTFLNDFKFYVTQFGRNIIFEKCIFKTFEGFEGKKIDKNLEFRECIFQEHMSFEGSTFKSLANFEECTFEKDANFEKVIFYSHDIDYEGVVNQTRFTKATFMGKADFTKASFNTRPSFSKTKFIKDAIFNSIQPSHHIYFKDSEFFENADFKNIEKLNHSYFDRVIFHKNVDFTNTNFIDYVSFTQASFKGSAYFNNAIFKNFINMSNCTIDDVISFYDAKLYYTPYLSGANIDKNARFNLMYIKQNHKIDIEQAVDEYMENLKEDKEHIRKNKEYGKIEIAQGFRESFRILKSYLITNHNLLEASFYRVNELKAKELEMDLTKDKLSLSEKLEKRLFQLYKITSNHHSDLLLILFTILSVIGGYYLFNLVIEFCYFKFNYWDLFKYCFYGLMAYMIYCLVLAFIECILNKDFKKYKFIYFISYALLIFSVLGIWNEPRVVTPFIGVFSDNAKNHFLNKAIINLEDYQAISIANRLNPTAIYLNESQAKKDLLANKDIIKEDELILNAYNEALLKGKNADEFMTRINIVYYILMILCLFSLQKTARKNSIIPN